MKRVLLWICLLLGSGVLVLTVERLVHRVSAPRAQTPEPSQVSTGVPTDELSPGSEISEPGAARREVVEQANPQARSRTVKEKANQWNLHGAVRDDLGHPVAGIQVMVSARRQKETLGADTKSDGTFRLILPKGEWELTVVGNGGRRSPPLVVEVPTEESVTLVLPRSSTLAGMVVDTTGAPLAEAKVYLAHEGEEVLSFIDIELKHRALTDALGRFRIEDVLAGTLKLAASSSVHPTSAWIEVSVAPGESREGLRIELGGGGRIEGSLDPALGEIANQRIGFYSFQGAIGWREAESDASGRFVIEGVIPQAYVIELKETTVSEAFGGRIVETGSGIRKNITVEDGQTTHVVFGAPARSILVHGTITSGGRPLAGAKMRAHPRGDNEDTNAESVGDLDGSYELKLSGPGDYWFHVSVNDGSDAGFERTVPDQDEVEISFDVPSGAITGRIVAADGRPLRRRVPITALKTSSNDQESFYRERYRSMYTEADGTFEFRLLSPGTYTLRAPDGFQNDSPPPRVPHGRVVLPDLVLEKDALLTGVELRVPPESRISGVVVDAHGNGVSGVWIRVMDARGLSLSGDWETQTGAAGHFDVANVGPGVHTVRAKTAELEGTSAPFQVEEGKTASTRIELR